MARGDNRIDLTIGADDEASEVLDDVAKKVEQLDDGEATVELEADTRDALSKIERFEREVDDITDDARELRFEFRSQTINREITKILRELEKLEDPIEIDAKTQDLERAQQDLRDLSELADRKYEIEIDADPKRTAQRAAGDIDGMRQKGEGLQSALPALRGFTDELGGTAQTAGVASQAIADLGDFSLIMGERFGIGQQATARLGTALGALGLGGVIIGGVAAGFQFLQKGARETAERIGVLTDAILEQLGVVDDIEGRFDDAGSAYEIFSDRLISDEDDLAKVNGIMTDLGITIEDLPSVLEQIEAGNIEELIEAGLGGDKAAEALREMRDAGVEFEDLDTPTAILTLPDDVRAALAPFEDLVSVAGSLHVEETSAEVLDTIAISGEEARASIEALREANPDASEARIFDLYVQGLEDQADAADDATSAEEEHADALEETERAALEALDAAERLAQAELDAADAALEAADARRAAADAGFAFTLAQNDFDDRLAESNEVLADNTATWNDHEEAQINVAKAAGDVADAAQRVAEEQAAAAGETLTQSQATDVWNGSMLAAAASADGPLRQSILNYIAEVNGIPPEKVSEIEALIDEGKLEEASIALAIVSEKREAEIEAEANKTQAERDLDNTARTRTATINAKIVPRNVRNGRFYLPGGGSIPLGISIGGGGAAAGPQPVPLARAGTPGSDFDPLAGLVPIHSSRGVTEPVVNNITVNLPRAAEARDVRRVLSRFARVNGR